MRVPSRHFVCFYDDESSPVVMARDFIAAGRRAGETVCLFAPQSLQNRVKRLCDHDNGTGKLAPDSYVTMDPAEILAQFPVDESQVQRSAERFAALLEAATNNRDARVHLFATVAGQLYADGQIEAARRLEDFWNRVAEIRPVNLCCSYRFPSIPHKSSLRTFMDICAEHAAFELPRPRDDLPGGQRFFAHKPTFRK